MARKTFDDHVRSIVDGFLQTVVVVDDEALPKDPSIEAEEDTGDENDGVPGGTAIGPLRTPADAGADGHELPAREVMDAFAARGLVCSILHPDESVDDRLKRTAARADLLVIDWWLNNSRGGRALELIRGVLQQDETSGQHRLRVIAIYTGQPDLHIVARELEAALTTIYFGSVLHRDSDGLAMTKGPVRLAVFAKEHVTVAEPSMRSNKVKIRDLPERLAQEFTVLTRGLVSSVALRALAALRQDTHRILENLGPGLDPGYLGHRIAQQRPAEAEDHLTAMVAAEIESVLADLDVGAQAGLPAIRLWLSQAARDGLALGALFSLTPRLTRPQIVKMLRDGLGDDDQRKAQLVPGRSDKHLRTVRDSATKLFCIDEPDSTKANALFADRMMIRTIYGKPRRELRLGTVVFRNKRFLLCVQPICDSLRLPADEDFSFPFLSLGPPEKGKTDFIVRHPLRDEWVPLQLDRKPRGLEMLAFRPSAVGAVVAYKDRRCYFFKSGSIRYKWVADLKPEFAQRVAAELAQQFSRVGLDEPEILRLSRS